MDGSVRSNFDRFLSKANRIDKDIESSFEQSIKIASGEMIRRAKEKTPPLPGVQRGKNTVTGALADHWGTSYEKSADGTYSVYLYNNMQYASYVNDGHRMVKHFVPWLYIDSSGLLARHIPITGEQLFGLVVGTRTQYVQPYKMVESAQARFLEAFDIVMSKKLESNLN